MGFPRSFWVIELLLSVAVLGGVRFAIRAASDWAPRTGASPCATSATDAVLRRRADRRPDGAVRASASPTPASLPVGFIDDDPALAAA